MTGGVFTSKLASKVLQGELLQAQWLRDEDGMRLLGERTVDLAFLGTDKLTEGTLDGRFSDVSVVDRKPIDCRMVLAGSAERFADLSRQLRGGEPLSVTTSYPEIVAEFAQTRGYNLRPGYVVEGGCEGYVGAGRDDLVFDICKTGKTLDANNLRVFDDSDRLDLAVIDACEYVSPAEIGRGQVKEAKTLKDRYAESQSDAPSRSFTVEMFRDQNKRVKKVGEEVGEVYQAALRDPVDVNELANEVADLFYFLKVLAQARGVSPIDISLEEIRRNQLKGEK